MKLTFLGTGTSFGVPQIGCSCAVCHSTDPRDRRTRAGALIETDAATRLLIDTSPELRLQLVAAQVSDIDAVLYTHEHADHIHGIDDLRALTLRRGTPLPVYADSATIATLRERFPYIADEGFTPLPGTTRPEIHPIEIIAGVPFTIGDAEIVPFRVPHGSTSVMGFRIGPLGYVTDAKSLSDEAREILAGVEVLVLNALLRTPHPAHFSVSEAVEAAGEIGAKRTFLTHLTHDTPHAELAASLPEGIRPAYDGLAIHI